MTEEEETHLLILELFDSNRVLATTNTLKVYNIHPHDIRFTELVNTANFLQEKEFVEFIHVQPNDGLKLNSAGERYFENLIKKRDSERLQKELTQSVIKANRIQNTNVLITAIIAFLTLIAIVMQVYLASRQTDISVEQLHQSKTQESKLKVLDTLKLEISKINLSLDSMRVLRDTNTASKIRKN